MEVFAYQVFPLKVEVIGDGGWEDIKEKKDIAETGTGHDNWCDLFFCLN